MPAAFDQGKVSMMAAGFRRRCGFFGGVSSHGAAITRISSLTVILISVGCSKVENVQLGQAAPPFGPFGTPYALAELGSCQNPTLTADLLEIYITTDRTGGMGNNDTWVAKRSTIDEPFSTPVPVPNVNSASEESSPAVSLDGLTLWFGSDRPGGSGAMDIWVSTRNDRSSDWSTPTPVTALNSTGYEIPRPVGDHGLQMPLSRHGSSGNYQTYMATRPSVDADWRSPQPIVELAQPSVLVVDGFLTDDGTMLLLNIEQPGNQHSEMFRTWRLNVDESFASPVSLGSGLNSTTLNRDPWLSPDGNHFFFSSDRSGTIMVYEADTAQDQ